MNNEGGPKKNRNDNADNKGNPSNVAGFLGDAKSDFPPTDANSNKSDDKPQSTHARVKYWFEMAGIFFGVVGVVCLIVQSCALIQSNKVFSEQLREMQQSRILDERAWVFANKIRPGTVANPGAFVVGIKNSGKTPALNFRTVIGWDNQTNDIAKIDTLDTNDFMVLAPDTTTDVIIDVGTEYVRAVERGAPLWICGINRYDDIFGKHHWSTYCWKIGSDLETVYGTPVHNSCDDAQTNQSN